MASGLLFAGIELGGTKSIAVLARENEVVDQITVPTQGPGETLGRLSNVLRKWSEDHPLAALGIASFGPIRLDRTAPEYGRMHETPKPGWSGAPVTEALSAGLDCPWTIDTDVNGAALAEYRWGAGRGAISLCYVTIGTGVGGGLVIDGRTVHGAMHPEIGHLSLRRLADDRFEGACRFHGDCIEGLISGPALAARFGGDPSRVTDDDFRWEAVASDIAELAGAILLTISAQRILIGGGVGLARASVLDRARALLVERQANYLPFLRAENAQDILRAPELGDRAGPLGAIALAMHAAEG
ncbi:MAG: ROK family protein [Porphyrobacter sp.]|nr:ROK family protein [Porphyrobacter sp.]